MSAFDKVIGYADVKMELIRFCDVLKNPGKYEKLGVSIPSGIMLVGDPGLGKTMLANCFIEESGCKSYILRKSRPDGKFVNDIRSVFDSAKENAPAIILLDDLDKFANEDRMHLDAEEYVAVQTCIDECKNQAVFVLATVNDRDCMPESLMRAGRFDKIIELSNPRGRDAERIVKHFLSQKETMGDIDADEVVRIAEGHSCAELETVINEAGIYAGFDGRGKIEQKDLIKACLRMVYDAPECVDPEDSVVTRGIAIHEAGHVVVAEVLSPGSVNLVSICRHSGSIGGVTGIHREDGFVSSIRLQENEVKIKLAGRAATEIIRGEADCGFSGDYDEAYRLVSDFYDSYHIYGFNNMECDRNSEFEMYNREKVLFREMDRYYEETKRIIMDNRAFLDRLIECLIESETLTRKDISRLKNGLKSA